MVIQRRSIRNARNLPKGKSLTLTCFCSKAVSIYAQSLRIGLFLGKNYQMMSVGNYLKASDLMIKNTVIAIPAFNEEETISDVVMNALNMEMC